MASSLVLVIMLAFFTHASEAVNTNKSCPTWLYLSEEGWCTCGSRLLNVIICNNITQKVSVLNTFCLTSFNTDQDPKEPVVGRCIFVFNHGKYIDGGNGLKFEVDQNLTQQDHQLCDYLNREGRLCGACKENHFLSPYSYDFKCYKCHTGLLGNIIMYLTVAYVPLTAFLVLVVVLHISVSSPHMNVAIFLCQVYALPTCLRLLTQVTRNTPNYLFITRFFATVYGIWNLDFFRALVPPICLPLTTMQVMALDYLVAVYPLLLLVCFYALVTAHDRGCRLVVRLWRPFLWCSARIRQEWNAKHSIIDAFATFIILSYVKFLSVSSDLITASHLYDVHGSHLGYYMYYDATVKLIGQQHMPYFIIAMTVLFIAILFPLLLMLYPMKWFQVFLNKCELNSPGLRMFMECFQGYYRDRSDGGWDCRWFAALYPSLRIGGVISSALIHNRMSFPLLTLIGTATIFVTLLVNPYKQKFKLYIKLEVGLLLFGIALCASLSMSQLSVDWNDIGPTVGFVLAGISSLIPFLYLTLLFLKSIARILRIKWFSCQIKHILLSVYRWRGKQQCARNTEEFEQLCGSRQMIQSVSGQVPFFQNSVIVD